MATGFRLLAACCAAATLCGCGLAAGDDPKIPPLTSEPQAPDSPPAPAAQTRAARQVLVRFLRGLAAGDRAICALVTPDYGQRTFGAEGCRKGLAEARGRLSPEDRAALRTVKVPAALAGPAGSEFSIRFEDLKWQADPPTPGGPLATRYILSKTGGTWLISG